MPRLATSRRLPIRGLRHFERISQQPSRRYESADLSNTSVGSQANPLAELAVLPRSGPQRVSRIATGPTVMKRLSWWRRPYFSRRVLEIGPGHNPFAGVTHLLERNVADGRERGGHALLVPAAAHLIVGEATVLPFAAGSFDFVYASHVLEHVDDPEAACGEMMRVAAAGYIETPSDSRTTAF